MMNLDQYRAEAERLPTAERAPFQANLGRLRDLLGAGVRTPEQRREVIGLNQVLDRMVADARRQRRPNAITPAQREQIRQGAVAPAGTPAPMSRERIDQLMGP